MRKPFILIAVEPDQVQDLKSLMASELGARVEIASSGGEVLEKEKGQHHDAIVLGVDPGDESIFEVAEALARNKVSTPVIMVSGDPDKSLEARALAAGAKSLVPVSGDHYDRLIDELDDMLRDESARDLRVARGNPGEEKTPTEVFQAAFDSVRLGLAVIDKDFRVMLANGWARENILTMHPGAICYETLGSAVPRPCRRCPVAACIETGQVESGVGSECLLKGKEYIRMIVSPVVSSEQDPSAMVVAFIDETEALETQRRVLQEAKLRMSILNSSVYGILVTENDARIIFVNSALEDMTEFSTHELVGWKPPYPFWPDELIPEYIDLMEKLKAGEAVDQDMVFLRKDGARINVTGSHSVVKDEKGEIIGLMAVISEITEVKQMAKYVELLSSAVEHSGHGVCICDLEGNIIFVNRKQCEMIRYTRDELMGNSVAIFLGKEALSEDEKEILDEIGEVGFWEGRLENVRKDGTGFPVHLVSNLIKDGEGNSMAIASSAFDMTDVAQRERELMEKNLDLELFAHALSHDFKNPLLSIEGYTQLLEKAVSSELEEQQQEWLDRITINCRLMSGLVDDLLEIPGVSEGEEPESVDSGLVFDEVLITLEVRIREKNAKVRVDGKLPVVRARRGSLLRIFTNLVSNGLTFNRAGVNPEVKVGAEHKDDLWEFYVKDNGRGLREEEMESVFTPFETGEDSMGSGIGMTIVKRTVEAMGGRIWFDSELGKGTTVYFTVPSSD